MSADSDIAAHRLASRTEVPTVSQLGDGQEARHAEFRLTFYTTEIRGRPFDFYGEQLEMSAQRSKLFLRPPITASHLYLLNVI